MSKLKIFILFLIIMALPVIVSAAVTNATHAGTTISNFATVSFSNAGGTIKTTNRSTTNTHTVLSIFGLESTDTTSETNPTAPGVATYYSGEVINVGNTNIVVTFTNLLNGYSGVASGWTVEFTNSAGSPVTTMTLAEGQTRTFQFSVTPTAGALFGQSLTNQFSTYYDTAGLRLTDKNVNYTGLNGTNYGGTNFSGVKTVITILEAPVIEMAKLSYVTNDASYILAGGALGDVVPGSAIIYGITFTNSGNTPALGLEISDTLPIAEVDFVPGSIKYDHGLKRAAVTLANYNAAQTLTDGTDDNWGAYSIGAIYDGTDTIDVDFDNVIPDGGSGTIYYKVFVK